MDEAGFQGRIVSADNHTFTIRGTTVRFAAPIFHGIEYASPGWVFGVVVQRGGKKLLYSSNLQGPIIEDYAAWIIEEKSDVWILDGPAPCLLARSSRRRPLSGQSGTVLTQ